MNHNACRAVRGCCAVSVLMAASAAHADIVDAAFTGGIMTIQGRALDTAGAEQRGDVLGTVEPLLAQASGETGSGLVDASIALTADVGVPTGGSGMTIVTVTGSGSASQPAGYGGFANITAFTRDFPLDGVAGDWIDLRLTIDQDAFFSITERDVTPGTAFVNFDPDASTGASINGDVLAAGTYTMRAFLRVRLETTDTFVENNIDWELALTPVPTPGSAALLAVSGLLAGRRQR